jgi:tRNA A-37 threonylcarbamoyl transferase component Bud32
MSGSAPGPRRSRRGLAMAGEARVLRGAFWGERLRQLLPSETADIGPWMERNTELLKCDGQSLVGLLQLQGRPRYLKLYRSKSALQRLAFRLGLGRGVRAFDRAAELAAVGVPVPEPLGCLQVREGMLLLTEGLAQSRDLKSIFSERPPEVQLRRVIAAAGGGLAALHAAGYAHGDCKWSNLLWSGGQLFFVDLEGVRRSRPGSSRCLRDLARFTLNAEDMGLPAPAYGVFLESYATAAGSAQRELVRGLLPPLQRLRRRHLAKYGPRGHRLV